jgi:3-hydroxymyristoyl/3-hydroxydecanoyl-(acyl carrier protein) dehydratase
MGGEAKAGGAAPAYDIMKIRAALPHRYPLRLFDRVISLEIG